MRGMRRFVPSSGYWDCFEELRYELEEALDLGNGVTFLVNRQLARPVGSTAYVRIREAHVIEWVEGMIVRLTVYNDIDEGRAAALEAVGPAE